METTAPPETRYYAGARKKLKGVSKLDDLENVDDLSKLGNLDNVDDLGKLKNIDNMEGSALVDDVGKGGKGGSGPDNIYDLYRKASNTGEFQDLEELMQLKNVKNIADKAGIGLNGVKIKIDRNLELLGKGLYGYTDGKTITLYPDAFTDIETLVKTLGHERMHVYQVEVFGKPLSTDVLKEFEKAAFGSEKSWWEYFEYLNGGKK